MTEQISITSISAERARPRGRTQAQLSPSTIVGRDPAVKHADEASPTPLVAVNVSLK